MTRKRSSSLTALLFIASLLSVALLSGTASAIIPQNTANWFWTSDTNAASVATADVDGDGGTEIVTAGYYNDGTRWIAQLHVWNGSTLAAEGARVWLWGSDTQVSSVAVGDVDGDGGVEIVTGGVFFDGTRWIAQLHVWNGSTLVAEGVQVWYWIGNTYISSIVVGNADADVALEIISGGAYFDGTRWIAQLMVWNGATLALENVRPWYWTSNTYINSVAVANVDADSANELVTGGSYFDGTRWIAQLMVWDGSTLALENVMPWYWTGDTDVTSVAVGDVDGDGGVEIVTGGQYNDSVRIIAQLSVWTGSTLAFENVYPWFTVSDTRLSSVAIGNVDADPAIEIVTGGSYFDGATDDAQLMVLAGSNLLQESGATWLWTAETHVDSIAISNVNGASNSIVAAGGYSDLTRSIAQLTVWG